MKPVRILTVVVLGGCLAVACVLFAVTQPLVTPKVSTPPAVDAQRLEAHVRHLSVDLYPRSYDRFGNIRAAGRYIQEQWGQSGARVTVQDVVTEDRTYQNIIAHFGPDTGPVMVIGAHYDSHGDAQQGAHYPKGYDPETHTPGADDNATGVAGLLELGRLLVQHPPAQAVELVAYTLEEPPYFRSNDMGSAWHARSLVKSGREVRCMLALEMIGYFSDAPQSQQFPIPAMKHLYGDRGNFIALVGKMGDFSLLRKAKAWMAGASDLPVYSINAPALLVGVDFSDHQSYWNAGFPAFMVTDTAFYRNPHYHQAGDTPEKLDWQRMAKVVQGVYAFAQNN